jgi:CubicO group peptidase (beta-lactamase class C family)
MASTQRPLEPEGSSSAAPHVGGFVADGFEPVREAFLENLRERDELGAAFAVTHRGAAVVDLWGGLADGVAERPWREDTLQVIFSGTKGLVALCLLMLADRGALDLEAPVARCWPEFAVGGKADVTVLDVASHQAGLPGVRRRLVEEDVLDPRSLATMLAVQPRETDPRAVVTYHPLTYGWLCGEIVRRVDGRSIGRFFAEEVAAPLDLEVWIGLPPALESRVSRLAQSSRWGEGGWDADAFAVDELLRRIWDNPPLFAAGRIPWNAPAWHRAEIPGAGAIATARSMAKLYGCLALGGELDGVRLLRAETLERGRRPVSARWDPIAEGDQVFGTGFELQSSVRTLGPAVDAFGHCGAGGSVHAAWPSLAAGVSYAMNEMRDDDRVDARAQALLDATHAALTGAGPGGAA